MAIQNTVENELLPKIVFPFNKAGGIQSTVFWKLNLDTSSDIYSAENLSLFSANCQLKTQNPDTCEFSENVELFTTGNGKLEIVTTSSIVIEEVPPQTVNNPYGIRLNLPSSITSLFTWDKAVGVINLITPTNEVVPFIIIEFVAKPLGECNC